MIEEQPRAEWADLPRSGCKNVKFRVLLDKDNLTIANLKFAQNATIDRHDASFDIDVICMSGAGFTSIDEAVEPISAGQTLRWPKNKEHCLWTENTEMETIMIERPEA